MAEEGFNKLWEGEADVEVCIKHHKQDFLRVDGDEFRDIDWNGKSGGGRAKWTVEKDDDGFYFFKNTKTENYLRVQQDGTGLDTNKGKRGPLTYWHVEPISKGYFIIKTKDEQDNGKHKFIGCKPGSPKPVRIYTIGESDKFSEAWDKSSEKKETVIVAHSKFKNLRDQKDDVNANGGNGKLAQWKLIFDDDCVRFKGNGDGFLRIEGNGDIDCKGVRDGGQTSFELVPAIDGDNDAFQHIVYIKSKKHGNYISIDEDGAVKPCDEACNKCRFALFTEED